MRRETIERLSERWFVRKRRLLKVFQHLKASRARLMGLVAVLVAVVLLAAVSSWLDREPARSSAPEPQASPSPPPVSVLRETPGPAPEPASPPTPPPYHRTKEVIPKYGDTLFDLLIEEGIPASRIHELVVAARPVHDLGRLRKGNPFTLEYDERDGRVLRLELNLDGEHLLVVERKGEGLCARKEAFKFQIQHRVASGTIRDSLFLAADDAGLPPSLTLALAEIYAWDIDFNVDMRDGDRFQVLYEEKYLDGSLECTGRILAALILNRDHPFWAFYFRGSDGRADYYDQKGRSLRKVFLKSPLQYRRISSRYSRRRLHPILKIYRPHLGVDYAAPIGTPVRTIGDGRVVYVGWEGGYGRFIKVRHNGTYMSTYGHLHRFAKGIKRGKYVHQGQVVGYVGSTGLSTGPHLDFRLLKNGRFINPLKVNFPSADPVRKTDREDFRRRMAYLMAQMERKGPAVAQTKENP